MGRRVGGVEVLPTRNEARDRAWGIWLNSHPDVKAMCDDYPMLRDWLGMAWGEAWHAGSLDAVRRNDQVGIIGLELARRLQEHIDLIMEDVRCREVDAEWDRLDELECEAEVGSPNWPSPEEMEQLPF